MGNWPLHRDIFQFSKAVGLKDLYLEFTSLTIVYKSFRNLIQQKIKFPGKLLQLIFIPLIITSDNMIRDSTQKKVH